MPRKTDRGPVLTGVMYNHVRYFAIYYKWDILESIYEFPIRSVTLQGLEVLRDEDNRPLLPPIRKPKRGRPKLARIPVCPKVCRIFSPLP